jgi:hypothetical protein
MAISAQRMFLVSVSGIPGYFQTKSGGETTSETARNFDGGSLVPQVLAGPADRANVTVSRAWSNDRDRAIHKLLRDSVGKRRASIYVQPANEDLVATGPATTYTNALLVRVSEPDIDSGSGDPAMFELEFAVGAVV